MLLRRRLVSLAFATLFGVLPFAACSDMAEGDQCSPLNNNDDCQSGLTCQHVQDVTGTHCCPPDLTQATSPNCHANSAATDANVAPPDSGAPETAPDSSTSDAVGDTTGGGDATGDGAID